MIIAPNSKQTGKIDVCFCYQHLCKSTGEGVITWLKMIFMNDFQKWLWIIVFVKYLKSA